MEVDVERERVVGEVRAGATLMHELSEFAREAGHLHRVDAGVRDQVAERTCRLL